jgi:uncharacterized membrane protein
MKRTVSSRVSCLSSRPGPQRRVAGAGGAAAAIASAKAELALPTTGIVEHGFALARGCLRVRVAAKVQVNVSHACSVFRMWSVSRAMV